MDDAPTKSLSRHDEDRTVKLWTVVVLYTNHAVHTGPGRPLPAGDCLLGRSVSGQRDLHFPHDDRLSRKHACFKRRGDQLSVHDLGSHNGTHVNGHPVDKADLADGDVVRCGNTLVLVRRALAWPKDASMPKLIGGSPAMMAHRAELQMVAQSDASIILTGETGCGKGAAARALHQASSRAGQPLVSFNCAAIPETLAESTLFGHTAGAFTGAAGDERGLLRAADGGTLFIDEVGDLPGTLQPKLLHFLDDGSVMPVGSTRAHQVNARVVAATHVDLEQAVENGTFRADLYARLAAIVLVIPPLRDRREDILGLLLAFVGQRQRLTADLAHALLLYRWPWNVRELQRVATELSVRGRDQGEWDVGLAPERVLKNAGSSDVAATQGAKLTPGRDELNRLLREHRGVVAQVAKAVGRSPKQVYRWMKRHGLDIDDYRA